MNERSAEARQLQHTTTTSANIDYTHLKARTHKQDRVLYDTYVQVSYTKRMGAKASQVHEYMDNARRQSFRARIYTKRCNNADSIWLFMNSYLYVSLPDYPETRGW